MVSTVITEDLKSVELIKRNDIKTRRPRVYEKIQKFHAGGNDGVISPIIRLAWSYLCNFECDHCCAEERMDRTLIPLLKSVGKQETRRRMNYEDLARIAKEADEYGIFRFVLTGGEPSTWPDLYKVIEILDPNRHLVIMDSNGYLLAERKGSVQKLADAGIYKMQVSLDSFIEEEHDRFRNKPGSYRRVMQILPEIVNAGMSLLVSTCLVKDRAFSQEFEDLCKFCEDIGGVLYVTYAKPTGTCKQHEDWVITKRDADKIRELEKKYKVFTHMTPSFGRFDGCITVKGINTLEPWGDLVPCPYMDWAIGNIFQDSLADILQRGMLIRDLGPQRDDCLIGEDLEFISRHNAAVAKRKAEGNFYLPVPWGEGWTEKDLIQIQA